MRQLDHLSTGAMTAGGESREGRRNRNVGVIEVSGAYSHNCDTGQTGRSTDYVYASKRRRDSKDTNDEGTIRMNG